MADLAQITHLLRRTEYVARPERVQQLQTLTLDLAVEDVLGSPTPVALPTQLDHTDEDQWEQFVFANQWWLDRMAYDAPRKIHEKMTMFWHGHFTSEWWKVYNTKQMMQQNKLYRDNCLGDFRVLAQQMAIEPAMLRYLDNADNTKGSPNQNFARELMELFLLGVGNYTEGDVEAAALAWTGHTIDANGNYVFTPANHSTATKTFFGETRNFDGPDIITKILSAKQQIVARFIVGKLWAYFATPTGPQPAALDAIATAFGSNWSIRDAVRSILLLPEFYATAVVQGLVRTPTDWVVAGMYHSDYRAAVVNPQWWMEGMGQIPYVPPNVSGWRPNGAWINTSSMSFRAGYAANVVYQLRNDARWTAPNRTWDQLMIRTAENVVVPVDTAIDEAAKLFGLDLSAQSRAAMRSYVQSERAAGNNPTTGRNTWWEVTNLLTMAMLAPEMHVA